MIKFPKPGKKPKGKIKNKSRVRLHDLKPPKERHCRFCNVEGGTEAYRHAESTRIKFLVGGGVMGSKIDDNLTSWLCSACDMLLSKKPDKDASNDEKNKHDLEWAICIIKTWLI